MLAWLVSKGWDVAFLDCPLSGEEPGERQIAVLEANCDNLVYINRDGQVRYSLSRPDLEAVVAALDGRPVRSVAGLLDEELQPAARLLGVMRSFSPDALIEVLCAIDEALAPKILLANYVFMTRGLPLLCGGALKIVDTIDLLSTKSAKVTSFGIEDGLAMSDREEAHLLSRADLLLAIQPDEAAELRRISPEAHVLTVGVDIKVDTSLSSLIEAPIVLLVASGNPMNTKVCATFYVLPGHVCCKPFRTPNCMWSALWGMRSQAMSPVRRLGIVDDLGQVYSAARIVINPAAAGTGL